MPQVEGAFQGMVASSSVLNAPNCSVPCEGEKNRKPCAVSGHCGECAAGFVGVRGPSNVPCYTEVVTKHGVVIRIPSLNH